MDSTGFVHGLWFVVRCSWAGLSASHGGRGGRKVRNASREPRTTNHQQRTIQQASEISGTNACRPVGFCYARPSMRIVSLALAIFLPLWVSAAELKLNFSNYKL